MELRRLDEILPICLDHDMVRELSIFFRMPASMPTGSRDHSYLHSPTISASKRLSPGEPVAWSPGSSRRSPGSPATLVAWANRRETGGVLVPRGPRTRQDQSNQGLQLLWTCMKSLGLATCDTDGGSISSVGFSPAACVSLYPKFPCRVAWRF